MDEFTGVDNTMSLADVQKLPGNAPVGSESFDEMLGGLNATYQHQSGSYTLDAGRVEVLVWATASRRDLDVLDRIMAEYEYFFHKTRLPRMRNNQTEFLIREYSAMGKKPNPSALY